MIVVIQCAAKKQPNAGHLRARSGKPVLFVAYPHAAPPAEGIEYAHPDAPTDTGLTWREVLDQYNLSIAANPLGLLRAVDLYVNPIYRRIVERFGLANTYILSAGWGLISADFFTPNYDITFSQAADRHKQRKAANRYCDFCQIPADTDQEVVFLGSKSYIPLFCKVTQALKARRIVFYRSNTVPEAPGCTLVHFETTTRTNWQYECAQACLNSSVQDVMQRSV